MKKILAYLSIIPILTPLIDLCKGLRDNSTGETFINTKFIDKLQAASDEEKKEILKDLYNLN